MIKYRRLKGSRSGGPAPHRRRFSEAVNIHRTFGSSAFICGCQCGIRFLLEVFHISKLDHQLNEEIRDKEIRVIGPTGEQLGIMSSRDALVKAYDQGLDLVKIAPTATPPVCKIMDYGKFRFEQTKKEKEAKKNQHVTEIKEIRMSPGIDTNDFNVKVKNAMKFLKDGNRVKVTVRFRGREMAHTDIGKTLLAKFSEDCAELSSTDKPPKLEGRHMSIFLAPKSSK